MIRKHQQWHSVLINGWSPQKVKDRLSGECSQEDSSSLDVEDLIPRQEPMRGSLPPEIASFRQDEIVTNKLFGQGTFCQVMEIRNLYPSRNGMALSNLQSRSLLVQHCLRPNGDARYAMKRLRSELWDDAEDGNAEGDPDFNMLTNAGEALVDLITETSFLLQLEHTNIVRIRAIAHIPPFDPSFFLVVDRLYDTLEGRMRKWRIQAVRNSSSHERFLDRKGCRIDEHSVRPSRTCMIVASRTVTENRPILAMMSG
jgi:hypothetical protein